jgi:hypothetical protein
MRAGRNVGVLIEPLADSQPQAPERHVVRHIRRSDRAEENGIVLLERLNAAFRHQCTGSLVARRAPVEMRDFERELAVARRAGLQDFDGRANDLAADAVAGDGRDLIRSHRRISESAGSKPSGRPASRPAGPDISRGQAKSFARPRSAGDEHRANVFTFFEDGIEPERCAGTGAARSDQ